MYFFSLIIIFSARSKVSGGGDEDDAADEVHFMQESLELHYNVAELIGAAFFHFYVLIVTYYLIYIILFYALHILLSLLWRSFFCRNISHSVLFSIFLGSVFKTHGSSFTPVYLEHWHEMITEMGHVHCLKEDRQFSFFVVSDVIEFGLTPTTSASYLSR